MGQKITIGSVNRIEGHLKITVEVENGVVKDAWSSGTMARGFEILLQGKDPRDASYVVSRFCGVCFSVHQYASARALDQAFGATVPTGGRLLRNLAMGAEYLYDHIIQFYHLSALDYIDIMAVASYKGSDPKLMAVRDKIVSLVKRGDTYPLTPRYEPDQFSVKDPEIVTMAVAHYLQALDIQNTAKNMGAILGGRTPHYQSIVVGGMTHFPDVQQLAKFRSMLNVVYGFIKETYVPDVLLFGTGPLLKLAQMGVGGGHTNYVSYGGFDLDDSGNNWFFKPGVAIGSLTDIQPFDQAKIGENVKNAWYKQSVGDEGYLHPTKGETVYDLEKAGAYSFVKAPRYDGHSVEVGPLARAIIDQDPTIFKLVKEAGVKPGAVARHAARAVETLKLAEAMYGWIDELEREMGKPGFSIHDTAHWEPPATGQGAGFYEAPRGALGHWIDIADHKIKNYQAVVPSTINASPRDEKGVRGQYEEALVGAPVPDPKNPINVVRIIRSFDPCLACAIHLIEPNTNQILKFRVD